MRPLIGRRQMIYKTTIAFTMIPAILDLIHNLPPIFANTALISAINTWAGNHIPLYSIGLDFFPFMLIGLLGSWAISKFTKESLPESESSTNNN
jgi:LIVCS family branched-chain amino acid:cation transporter